jgi:hypothetical protein
MDLSYRLMAYLKNTPPAHGAGLRLGLWQGTGEAATPEAVEANLARLEAVLALASGLTGYIVTPELARGLAEPVHGPSLQRLYAERLRRNPSHRHPLSGGSAGGSVGLSN